MLPQIRDHCDRLLVILRQNSDDVGPVTGAEFHSFPNSEIKHDAMRSHLTEKSDSSYNLVVQLNQFLFGEGIDIEVTHGRFFPRRRAHFCI